MIALLCVQLFCALVCFVLAFGVWPYASLGRAVGGIIGSFCIILAAVTVAVSV